MPSYLITAPDGRKFNVTGPGTAEEALAHIQQSQGGGGRDFSQASEAPNDPGVMAAYANQRGGPNFAQATPTENDPGVTAAYDRTKPLSMADIGSGAVKNFLPSAGRFVGDTVNAVMHPIETVKNVGKLGMGAAEKLIPGQQSHEVFADAFGKFFADRYGGIENVKRTMAEDPVGFLADISTVMSGGSAALARLPGAAGTVGRVAGTVGRVADPVNAAVKGVKLAGKGVGAVASEGVGLLTGTGGTAIRQAAKAGYQGGEVGKSFRGNMRGNIPMEQVIADAKGAVQNIKEQRQAAYKAGMADVSSDRTVLDFQRIDDAMKKTFMTKVFEGRNSGIKISLEPSAEKTASEVAKVLDDWRRLPPDDFHTPEGLDALKQRLGDIQQAQEHGSASQKIATAAYNIVKEQIVRQAPRYAKTMENYQKASELIREIEGTLSLRNGQRIDTQLRKLQSVMRNNVNTNYGKRLDLTNLLEANGAKNLLAGLAGQSLNTVAPRGLARWFAGLLGGGGGAAVVMNPLLAAPVLGTLAASSPRLVGEVAHAGGRAARAASKIPVRAGARAAYQPGRLDRVYEAEKTRR